VAVVVVVAGLVVKFVGLIASVVSRAINRPKRLSVVADVLVGCVVFATG
jgi:hypothetical protein